jgi:hypothetical protein
VPDISDAFLGPRIAVLVSKVLEESLAEAAARLDVGWQCASMLRDAGKLGEVVTTGGGQCRIRWSGFDAHISARTKQHEGAAWRLQTGMNARAHALPEGAQPIGAPNSMRSGLGWAVCE